MLVLCEEEAEGGWRDGEVGGEGEGVGGWEGEGGLGGGGGGVVVD